MFVLQSHAQSYWLINFYEEYALFMHVRVPGIMYNTHYITAKFLDSY